MPSVSMTMSSDKSKRKLISLSALKRTSKHTFKTSTRRISSESSTNCSTRSWRSRCEKSRWLRITMLRLICNTWTNGLNRLRILTAEGRLKKLPESRKLCQTSSSCAIRWCRDRLVREHFPLMEPVSISRRRKSTRWEAWWTQRKLAWIEPCFRRLRESKEVMNLQTC